MHIRHVSISRFRGIRSLNWHLDGRIICLVGPGDSTKTTILDAIELTLAPKWFVPFTDADFYQVRTEEPISIEVTVGELSDELLADDKCGLYLRGYQPNQPLIDDPEDGWEPVITVQLRVSDDLEPHWELIKGGILEPKPLSWRDRERLSMSRLGTDVERHLTWSRGSALARITEKNTPTGPALALANRAANAAIAGTPQADLESAANIAQEAAKEFGVNVTPLKPGLDASALSLGSGALTLHDDQSVPLRATGLGTRRLTALGIQHIGLGPDAIILVDEVEHGLEPYRIRRLLKKLSDDKGVSDNADGALAQGQVLMTTHSPTTIMALPVQSLGFVRTIAGSTTVATVSEDAREALQSIVRRISHAVLARKILVCEGKTEEALCRVMDEVWSEAHDGYSFACNGVVPVNGGGSEFAKSAAEFRHLGYEVAVFGDSDVSITPSRDSLEADGITVVLWDGTLASEERITADLPLDKLQMFLEIAIDERDEESVLSSISAHLENNLTTCEASISTWLSTLGCTEAKVRSAIGKAAKKKGWFKDLNAGQRLADIVCSALPEIPDTDLAKKVAAIEEWAHAT